MNERINTYSNSCGVNPLFQANYSLGLVYWFTPLCPYALNKLTDEKNNKDNNPIDK